jgi:23S rRNA (cytidine1920-2'-O)/16S rRNA (cytidine1409-2'-O)-methyltransferase
VSGPPETPYASRGGLKLRAALEAFEIDAAGAVCADFGSHAGGFVDCLLRRGAARVYAVEAGQGVLDERLRRDARVVIHERRNAMQFICPEPCDLITIDVGWTAQRLILPAAGRSLGRPAGRVVTLVKPHYEAPRGLLRRGVLPAGHMGEVLEAVRRDIRDAGWRILKETESPIPGHGGNIERLMLLKPTDE